jgi:hypothetical protein
MGTLQEFGLIYLFTNGDNWSGKGSTNMSAHTGLVLRLKGNSPENFGSRLDGPVKPARVQ